MIRIFIAALILISCSYQKEISAQDYSALKESINHQRMQFHTAWSNSSDENRKAIVSQARQYIFKTLVNDIFPSWYGTKWDYNGTTQTPRQGYIACGYFVTHTLSDAGFKIPRIRWAQAASETFIREFSQTELKRFSYKPISEVQQYLHLKGDGIYLAGLDNHVGYIVVQGKDMHFVHSSYYHRSMDVISEPVDSDNPLQFSNYRVIGKLLSDEMVTNWLNGTSYY